MKKFLASLLIMIILLTNYSYATQYEEMNGDISPEEGFKGNPEDFYSKDKEIDFYHEVDEDGNIILPQGEEVKGSPLPEDGGKAVGPEAYKQDKMYYVPEGYIGYNNQLDFPIYMQKNSDFGGPASIEMVIDYIIGPSNTQEHYAEYMGTDRNGTDLEKMVEALNSFQNEKIYKIVQIDSKYHFVNCLIEALTENKPIIADISTTGEYRKGLWPYSMPGHYVVLGGMRVTDDAKTFVTMIDPYVIGKKEVELDQLYRMLEEHFARAVIK